MHTRSLQLRNHLEQCGRLLADGRQDFLAVGWAMNRAWYRQAVVAPVSLAIAAMAFYWMLERGGLLG